MKSLKSKSRFSFCWACSDLGTVFVIDMSTFQVITEIKVGEGVRGVTISARRKPSMTANNYSNDVFIIDVALPLLKEQIPETSVHRKPYFIFSSGRPAFVTHREKNNLAIIDTRDYKIIKEVPF
ncbi:hypothetical protein KHA80_21255 [Anaerobacillus sp. HL2]|nr:hypothetical protein KHA80_21255 [Anaerobacillus sp. HL2]